MMTNFQSNFSAQVMGLELFVSADGESENRRGCTGHTRASQANSGLTQLNLQEFEPYTKVITRLNLSNNAIESLPDNFFSSFSELCELDLSSNRLSSLPEGSCSALQVLDISGNKLTQIPEVITKCKHSLRVLHISNNLSSD